MVWWLEAETKISSDGDRKNYRSKSRSRKEICNYCKKEGHWKIDCPKLQKKKTKKKQKDTVNKSSDSGDAYVVKD